MNTISLVAILALFALPAYAQAQQPDTAKLKADAQNVFKMISGDKLKTQTYCQIFDLGNQLEQADRQQDAKTAGELSQKMGDLEKNLGPEYTALVDGLQDVDPNSPDGQEISSIAEKLDDLCKH